MPKDLGKTHSETMNARDTKQSAKRPTQTRLAFFIKNVVGTEDFFLHARKMILLVRRISWFEHGCRIYFFNGICGDPCFNSSWLVLFWFVFLSPSPAVTSEKSLSGTAHFKVAGMVRGPRRSEILCVFSAANIPVWGFPCLEYPLAISVVAFTQIKSTAVCSSLGKGWWAVFWQLYIKCRWLHECAFCLAQYINHNPQFLPKELEWIKLFNKTLLTWINSFLFCI